MKRIKHKELISAFIFIIIPILLYLKQYMIGNIPGNADMIQFFSAQKSFSSELLHGRVVQWNKYIANGMPTAGSTAFYIVSMLLSFLPLREFIYAYLCVHLFIGGYFFYKYLKECGCLDAVALAFGIIYECSIQINGLRKSHPTIIAAICLMPLIMYFVCKFFNTKETKWLLFSALIAGIQSSIAIQHAIYADMILLIYIVLRGCKDKYSIKDMILKGIAWIATYAGVAAYALLPSLSLMREYSKYGSSSTSYETFASYSMHPIKLLQMLLPYSFKDVYQSYGVNNSSEMDVEIYLGTFVLVLIIYCGWKKHREFYIELICMAAALAYAGIAHIPLLSKIVYNIPILGGFRCSGRMLFVFVFFCLSVAAKTFSSILDSQNTEGARQSCIDMKIVTCFLLKAVLIAWGVFLICGSYFNMEEDNISYSVHIFGKTLLVLLIGCVAFDMFFRGKYKQKLCISVFLIITLAEILPFSVVASPTRYEDAVVRGDIVQRLTKEIGEYKIWDAFAGVDGTHKSIISQNRGAILKLASINSYTAFNNPNLCKYMKNLGDGVQDIPFNFSGLNTGSFYANELLVYKNDLLSAIGVKYIIDSSGLIESDIDNGLVDENQYTYYESDKDGVKIYENKGVKDILFSPNEIKNVENFDDLYTNETEYNFVEAAYLVNGSSTDKKIVGADVRETKYEGDILTANVYAKDSSYLCFSQNYSKNWKAYVDGREVNVDFVDGLIMGISLEPGNHVIQFKYSDNAYALGGIISLVTLLSVMGYCIVKTMKKKG